MCCFGPCRQPSEGPSAGPFSPIAVRTQPAGQLRDKLEERFNEPRDLHAPSWQGSHALSTTRTTKPIPVMIRRKIPLPCRPLLTPMRHRRRTSSPMREQETECARAREPAIVASGWRQTDSMRHGILILIALLTCGAAAPVLPAAPGHQPAQIVLAAVKTGKERLSDKASDEQRQDDCKVPAAR